jgi:hypothetical protein
VWAAGIIRAVAQASSAATGRRKSRAGFGLHERERLGYSAAALEPEGGGAAKSGRQGWDKKIGTDGEITYPSCNLLTNEKVKRSVRL